MDKDEIIKKAHNPQYIEGIYNYCDRWCERCPLTSRCLNYTLTEEQFGEVSTNDLYNKAFWEKLKEMFQLTIEIITDWAKEQGIDLNALDVKSAAEEKQQRRANAENHELARVARDYGKSVDQWFQAEQPLFDQRQEELNTIVELGVGGDEPFDEADDINDAVEVIHWYQHQIYIKLMRALTQEEDEDLSTEDVDLHRDADGSVKVALIGMDRSIGAWGRLREYFPTKADDLLDVLLHLDRLRRQTESCFPRARSFIRPGFDTLTE